METKGVVHVFAPNFDWSVVYVNNNKVWEGYSCHSEPLVSVLDKLGGSYQQCEFTDKNEIDKVTPNKFSDIKSWRFL